MKDLYKILYITGAVIILFALLGGSASKSAFSNMADNTLESAGVNKNKIDSMDSSIDDIYYKMNQVMLQVDKLKNLFSDKKIDESKYARTNKQLIYKTIYEPMKEMVILLYRILFFSIGFFVLAAGGISHALWKVIEMKRRMRNMEDRVGILERSLKGF